VPDLKISFSGIILNSVADPHWLYADPDTDPEF
jgi:hypothetical protein